MQQNERRMTGVVNCGKSCMGAMAGLLFCFLILVPASLSADLPSIRINEVMASNASTIADEDGDHEDWIELYNAGDEAVNLIGFGLSDDYGNPFRWLFPDLVMGPGDFLLVWASGKNRTDPSQPLHANFSISSVGEEVILTHPGGTRLDEMPPTPMPTDISHGRKPDGTGDWFFFQEATPAAPNDTEGFDGILDAPVYSLQGGFFTDEQELELHHPDPAVTIVYTTDGSEPCLLNLDASTYLYKNDYPFHPGDPFGVFLEHSYTSRLYQGVITLADRSGEEDKLSRMAAMVQGPLPLPDEPVFKANVIRARAFREGMLPSEAETHTYFISAQGSSHFSLPVLSLAIQEDKLFDYELGIYTPGLDADQWRLDNPGEPFSWPYRGNFRRRGEEWEYESHLELFEGSQKERVLAQRLGLRIHGGATRSYPMKSLRLYARNIYGNSHLTHAFFDSHSQAYKRLILRNSGNDFPTSIWRPDYPSRTMFRDAAIQRIVSHMNFDTQAYQPVIVFLNGEYWGIQNIRERYDKHYLYRNYGVDEDQLDILTGKDEVKEGDNLHYRATIQYIETHGLEDNQHYEWVLTRIDERNFADYMIANIYADNTDWPGNNIDFWRLRTTGFDPHAPYGHDGRWRWMLFDMDFGFGLVSLVDGPAYKHNTLYFATTEEGSSWPNPPWSTFLLRSLLKNESFRNLFINRFADQLNTAFLPERTISIIEEMQDLIADEITGHFARWGYPDAHEDWLQHVGVMQDFVRKRPLHQRQHIMEKFNLEATARVQADVSNQLMGHVRVNTIDILPETPGVADYPYPWQGKYFRGVPIEVEAVAAPGYVFSHWEGTPHTDEPLLHIDLQGDVALKAHFERIDGPVLVHYWLFDTSLPNDTPLEWLDAFYSPGGGAAIEYHSALEGYPHDPSHPLWRKASMERRNQPASINYRPEGNNDIPYHLANVRGLQVKQPFSDGDRENTMIWHLPSAGFTDLVLRFAARDEGAADKLLVDYQWQEGEGEWVADGLPAHILPLSQAYQMYELDLSQVLHASNNPHFRMRIRFEGEDMHADEGNRVTFNNISLDGVSVDAHVIHATASSNGSIYPHGRVAVYHGSDLRFSLRPKVNHRLVSILVDGVDRIHELEAAEGEESLFYLRGISGNHQVHASFRLKEELLDQEDDGLLIYPNPARGLLHISSREEIRGVWVYGMNGQLLYHQDTPGVFSHTLDTADMRNGLYLLRIRTSAGTIARKLMVMH